MKQDVTSPRAFHRPEADQGSLGDPAQKDSGRLAALLRRADEVGLRCLADTWAGYDARYTFECGSGHRFDRVARKVMYRSVRCDQCHFNALSERFLAAVRERGGTLVTGGFSTMMARYRLRCAAGHEWEASGYTIGSGHWCPHCAHAASSQRYTYADGLARLHTAAQSRGGLCLADRYVNGKSRYRFRCAEGHEWTASASSVWGGTWCWRCARIAQRGTGGQTRKSWPDDVDSTDGPRNPVYTIADMQQIAADRGGRCLSTVYRGREVALDWQCANGHRWQAKPASVCNGRSWCRACFHERRRHTLEQMQQVAAERGGRCLSPGYVNTSTPLLWECSAGHRWEQDPRKVLEGSWCRQCHNDSLRHGLPAMQALAQSRGGRCLSTRYINARTPLRWRCSEGHVWDAAPYVIQKHWCQTCAARRRYGHTIDEMRALAHARGGACLSDEYAGTGTKLSWECHRGHVWQTTPTIVLGGSSCPSCAFGALSMGVAGVGLGFIFNNLNVFAQELSGRARFGIATALIQSTRMVGGMLGTATIGMLVSRSLAHGVAGVGNAALADGRDAIVRAIHMGFAIDVVVVCGAVVCTRRIVGVRLRQAPLAQQDE